jgi:hypothetical protein
MLSTVFTLFMFAWMLCLVLQFRLNAIPLVIALTTIMALIKLVRLASSANGGWRTRPENLIKRLSTRVHSI